MTTEDGLDNRIKASTVMTDRAAKREAHRRRVAALEDVEVGEAQEDSATVIKTVRSMEIVAKIIRSYAREGRRRLAVRETAMMLVLVWEDAVWSLATTV